MSTNLRGIDEASDELLGAHHLLGPHSTLLLEHDDGLLSNVGQITHDELLQ